MKSEDSKIYLETKSDLECLQKENKLKGMAMEELISYISDKIFSGSQETLGNLRNEAKSYLSSVFRVNKDFKLISSSFSEEYSKQYDSSFEYDLVFNLDELKSDGYRLQVPKKRTSLYLGYKKCSYCGNRLPEFVCDKCNGVITEDSEKLVKLKSSLRDRNNLDYREETFLNRTEGMWWCTCDNSSKNYVLKTKKCRSCNSGYFNKMETSVKKKEWETKVSNKNKKDLFLYLRENDFISDYSFSNMISSKRVDFWGDEKAVQIYESKNKEVTGLRVGDVLQASCYAVALKKSGVDANSVYIIYNGENHVKLERIVSRFSEDIDLDISLIPIKKWVKENEIYVNRIEIGKNIDGVSCGKNGEYKVRIDSSKEFKEEIPLVVR